MTTTKEDQTRADIWEIASQDLGVFADVGSFNVGWKACAESYEKKLAEKDAVIDERKVDYAGILYELNQANARNARLVAMVAEAEAALPLMPNFSKTMLVEAITANSESVAAWEAEKLATNKGKE